MLKKPARDNRFPPAGNQFESEELADFTGPDFETSEQPPQEDVSYLEDRGMDALAPDIRTQSIIDANSSFDGRYEAGQDLVILGNISGEVLCRGMLTIEREAAAKARVESRDAQIRGRLEGDIVCTGRLVLSSSANVTGTIKASALVVEEGASIRGTVETTPVAAISDLGAATKTARKADATAETQATSNSRWNRNRETPNFALVSSEERGTLGPS